MEGCTYALHVSILACRKGCVVLWSDYFWLLPCAWWDAILHSTSEGLQHTKDGAQARAYAQSQTNLDEHPAFQNMSWSNKHHNSPTLQHVHIFGPSCISLAFLKRHVQFHHYTCCLHVDLHPMRPLCSSSEKCLATNKRKILNVVFRLTIH
jgi:hypothetical protein